MIALLLALAVTQAAEPSYLVERLVATSGETRRVSVFRDGMTVWARRSGTADPAVIRIVLEPLELRSVRQVVEEAYDELASVPEPFQTPGEASVELRLAPPGRPPLVVRYPLTAVPQHAAARLNQMVDSLESRLVSQHPARENLSMWAPAVGDRAELEDGRIVEVVDLLDSPTGPIVRLQVGNGPAGVYLALDELRRLAVRRIRP